MLGYTLPTSLDIIITELLALSTSHECVGEQIMFCFPVLVRHVQKNNYSTFPKIIPTNGKKTNKS